MWRISKESFGELVEILNGMACVMIVRSRSAVLTIARVLWAVM